jgi:hypothetical protein
MGSNPRATVNFFHLCSYLWRGKGGDGGRVDFVFLDVIDFFKLYTLLVLLNFFIYLFFILFIYFFLQ